MRRLFLIIICALVGSGMLAAERVFVSTDQGAYLAGGRVWCSLFCVDGEGRLSDASSVAYLELLSPEGTVATAKMSLMGGRGCGEFVLPANLPTGNYRLVAYTMAQGDSGLLDGSKVLSIYNTFSVARNSGVIVGEMPSTVLPEEKSEGIEILTKRSVKEGSTFSIILKGISADVSLSVFHLDNLAQSPSPGIESFMDRFPIQESGSEPVEYEGEVIVAQAGSEAEGLSAVLSSAGSVADTYISTVRNDGSIVFNTGNIYGNRELVCEIPEAPDGMRMTLTDRFKHPSPGVIPPLKLHQSQNSALLRRKASLPVQVAVDTLSQFLPRREDVAFSGSDWDYYNLDDYTRFPTVSETIAEILTGVRVRKYNKIPQLEVVIFDKTESRRNWRDHVLTMMDGVVVTDLNLILDFDSMLLSSVEVCRRPIVFGDKLYNGVVNFVSSNNYVTRLNFANGVAVLDFEGVKYPVAYTGAKPVSGPDNRGLLYWHPSVKVDKEAVVTITAPAYSGTFMIVAQGLSGVSKPVYATVSVEVK